MANKLKQFKRNPGNIAFCYYRYSSDAQREESIDQQKQAAHEYAERNGFVIPAECEFEDRGITGTTLDRPGLHHMLFEAKHKRPAYLIVWKLDRLSRDIYDSFFIDAQLRKCGVQIVTVGEILPEDESLRFVIQSLYASMAQNFIVNHTSNVLRGLNFNAENALYNGHKILGYKGEVGKKYEIDEETAHIVKKIFIEYAEGKPLQKIADELNGAGLRTVKGNKFVVNSLAHILRNRAYIGEYKWGEYCIEDGMPRIVSDDLFYAAEKMLQKNRRGGKKTAQKLNPSDNDVDFWLTSHVYCGECGAPLHGTSGTSKNGKTHHYYTCLNHKKHKCDLKNKSKQLIENIAEYVIYDQLQNPSVRLKIAKMCYDYYQEINSDDGAYLKSLYNNLNSVEDSLNNFVKAIGAGIFNETTQQAMLELEHQREALNEQIEAEKLKVRFGIKLETIVAQFNTFYAGFGDADVKQRVLDLFIDKIYIYENKVVVTFHFQDDQQELSYEEIEQLLESTSFPGEYLEDKEYLNNQLENNADFKEIYKNICKVDSPDFFQ